MKKYFRVFEIMPGGWLMLSILFFFADLDEFLIVVCSVVIHEMGHLFALEHFRVPVRRITLEATGVTICYNSFLVYGVRELMTALAGPIFGVLASGLFSCMGEMFHSERMYLLAGCNLVLSAFNLLPAKPLDGWRCLYALFPRFAQVISVCTSILVLCVGLWVMYAGYGTALAVMGIILLLQDSPRHHGRKYKIRAC